MKNNHAPSLPEEEINKLVKELSDNNLLPFPYSSNEEERELTNKVEKIVNELVGIIKKEKEQAFFAGLEEGSKKKK